MPRVTLTRLRDYALERSLFVASSLSSAIDQLGFVQADPIRAPARAQDLTLRHRLESYRAGDLERSYPKLALEEDFFVNYGFLPRRHLSLMHPRVPRKRWTKATQKHAMSVLEFVRERGEVHPREVDAHFAHGKVTNYWGGSSNATTHLLDGMQYRGLLRVARRDAGIRVYAPSTFATIESTPAARARALLDLAIAKYAPLPGSSLGSLASRLRSSAPQLTDEIRAACKAAKAELPRVRVDGVDWYWPEGESPEDAEEQPSRVRLLAPFDPVVWDRVRFERFWGWAYRFEAYTPAPRRKLGYYAMPLLWRWNVIGWANVAMNVDELDARVGYVSGQAPKERAYAPALTEELERVRVFLTPRA